MVDWCDFPGSNRKLGPPPGMTEDECGTLPVYTDGKMCSSLWQFTDEEMERIIKHRQIVLNIYSGHTQPPVSLLVPEERIRDVTIITEK